MLSDSKWDKPGLGLQIEINPDLDCLDKTYHRTDVESKRIKSLIK